MEFIKIINDLKEDEIAKLPDSDGWGIKVYGGEIYVCNFNGDRFGFKQNLSIEEFNSLEWEKISSN